MKDGFNEDGSPITVQTHVSSSRSFCALEFNDKMKVCSSVRVWRCVLIGLFYFIFLHFKNEIKGKTGVFTSGRLLPFRKVSIGLCLSVSACALN